MPALCDRCQVFGHGSSNCKFQVEIENEDSRGEEDYDFSGSERGSSGSDEWVRVKRKRDRKKIKRREESKSQERTKSMKTSLQPVAGGDKSMPRQGNEQYRAQGPVRVQPMLRHLPFGQAPGVQLADVVGYSAPPLSPAARASLLVNAIDGSGKMRKRC
ncbi:hypothetical protein U1Q18_043612 [Sarracenia purpurea var. burkii]